MLVLTRRVNETFCIGDDILVAVLQVNSKQVKLGISAPEGVRILRSELRDVESNAPVDLSSLDDWSTTTDHGQLSSVGWPLPVYLYSWQSRPEGVHGQLQPLGRVVLIGYVVCHQFETMSVGFFDLRGRGGITRAWSLAGEEQRRNRPCQLDVLFENHRSNACHQWDIKSVKIFFFWGKWASKEGGNNPWLAAEAKPLARQYIRQVSGWKNVRDQLQWYKLWRNNDWGFLWN
jgi:carbon storage regulator